MPKSKSFTSCLFLSLLFFGCFDKSSFPFGTSSKSELKALKSADEIDELFVETLTPGTGQGVKLGQELEVRYQTWIYDPKASEGKGHLVQGNLGEASGFRFTLGDEKILPAWNEGLIGMKLNEKRKILTPPDLAYGSIGAGRVVPPHAPLIFEITLLRAKPAEVSPTTKPTSASAGPPAKTEGSKSTK